MTELLEAAEEFATTLTEVVNGTVTSNARYLVTPFDEPAEVAWVFPEGSTPARVALLPISAGLPAGAPRQLWLRASFQVRMDSAGDHLAVEQSVFALVIDERSKRPVVRMEYERGRGSEPDDTSLGRHRRNAAHVQIHGSSEPLAYIQGLHGHSELRDLSKFHVPVGGRRFRPSLEDFIEFLWSERLIPGLHEGWKDVIGKHRARWLNLQLRAAVRNDPASAINQLETMGYEVTPPRVAS
jgi:hypothetical protein